MQEFSVRVRAGWSGETAANVWRKSDVDCDETDLQRLAVECGFDSSALTTAEAFRILEAEANIFGLVHLMSRYPQSCNTPEYQAELQAYLQAKNAAITAVRQRQGRA